MKQTYLLYVFLQEEDAPKKPSAASIFGGAKPVDTTAREREIEEKLKAASVKDKEKDREDRDRPDDEDKQPRKAAEDSRPAPKKPSAASIFGGAKPVDTASKERAIEEKLKTKYADDEEGGARRPRRESDEREERPPRWVRVGPFTI